MNLMSKIMLAAIGLACLTSGATIERGFGKRVAAGTATVNLAAPSGAPQYIATGFIYGFPDNVDGSASSAIPNSLIAPIGFQYCRAGGAQLPAPNLGWSSGSMEGRWNSTLSNYRTTRAHGGRFQLLVHDLWGADGTGNNFVYPGDDDDWTSYDDFLTELIARIKAGNMLDGLELDIWNEPDYRSFWDRNQDQYLNMWKRGYDRFRQDLLNVTLIGPSSAAAPSQGNNWWGNFARFMKANNCVPDKYTYHVLQLYENVRLSQQGLDYWLNNQALPKRPVVINEYGGSRNADQSPAASAWYIASLERYNAWGLRAHWGSGFGLHDYMAGLVGKNGNTYWPDKEWYVYAYYNRNMTGQRVATTASADDGFDVYATRGNTKGTVKILAGQRPDVGITKGIQSYDITVSGLSTLGISGSVGVRTWLFDGFAGAGAPEVPRDLGIVQHPVVGDSITFWVRPETIYNAYAFEFVE